MEPWHLPETYRLVRNAFGRTQEHLARECTRSIVDRQNFAHFHYHEALRLSKAFERKHLKGRLLLELHTKDNKATRIAFEKYIIKAGAHATAAVQSVHAIPDILANAIYFCTGQNLGPGALDDRNVNVPKVVGVLKRDRTFHSLGKLLVRSHEGELWNHLAALANLSKHRTVVRTALNEDWTGKRKQFRELQFAVFERDEKQYWSVSLQALLGPEYDRLGYLVVEIGHELNRCLRERAA